MRHSFIRPPLHFTSIPFAPYYSHLHAGECAQHAHSVLSCFAFERAHIGRVHVRARAKEKRKGKEKKRCGRRRRKMREGEGRERCVHMIQPLHLMQVPFAPYCLSHCRKKAGDLPSLKRQLIPFPLARRFVCLFVFARASRVSVCACVHPFRQP